MSTVAAVAVFLVLVLLASQLAFDLYTRSVVTAVAFDTARVVAGADAGTSDASLSSAEEVARRSLGIYAGGATFSWRVTADQVVLSVQVENPSLLPRSLVSPLGLDRVTRTVIVRRERVR